MTRMAMSAAAPPLLRKLTKASCPGVSMTSKPGMVILPFNCLINGRASCLSVSTGK